MKFIYALILLLLSTIINATTVVIKTNLGAITVKLNYQKAPKTVANFLNYAKSGHYKNTIFHRVINDFMIQGGGFDTKFNPKETTQTITNEANNGLKNYRGTIAMARTSDPHSAGAQFFINVKDNHFLNHRNMSVQDWGYAVFGRVMDGMDTVDKIKSVKTGSKGPFSSDVPLQQIVIKSIVIK